MTFWGVFWTIVFFVLIAKCTASMIFSLLSALVFGVLGLVFAGGSGFMVLAPIGFFLGLGFCFFDWVSNKKEPIEKYPDVQSPPCPTCGKEIEVSLPLKKKRGRCPKCHMKYGYSVNRKNKVSLELKPLSNRYWWFTVIR